MLWVSSNMINTKEIARVWNGSRFHAALMVFTAVMVPVTDFLTGVLSALVLYGLLKRYAEPAKPARPDVVEGEFIPQTEEVAA